MTDNLPVLAIVAVMDKLRLTSYTHIVRSGVKGYVALKEMLQNGAHSRTMLVESHDLRDVAGEGPNDFLRILRHNTPANFWPKVTARCGPNTAAHLTVYANVLPEDFLQQHGNVQTIDLSHLTNITHIPKGFLDGCTSLTGLDLSPFGESISELPEGFLMNCTGLKTLDLSTLTKVTTLPEYFVSYCTSFTTLTLMPNVTKLAANFLSDCTALTTLNLSPLSKLSELPEGFLKGCSGMKILDLSPLSNLREIPEVFLYGCLGLTTLDFRPLSKLRCLPKDFLTGCTGLTTLDLSPFARMATLPRLFLWVLWPNDAGSQPFLPQDDSSNRVLGRLFWFDNSGPHPPIKPYRAPSGVFVQMRCSDYPRSSRDFDLSTLTKVTTLPKQSS